MKLDRRKKYYLLIDTETTSLNNPLVYDIGGIVMDSKGSILDKFTFVNSDVYNNTELMLTSYYANKLPLYKSALNNLNTIEMDFYSIKQYFIRVVKKYHITKILAYNLKFDYKALNNTSRTLLGENFFDFYNGEYICLFEWTKDVLQEKKMYRHFCEEHQFYTPTGRLKTSAEIVYRFIVLNPEIVEHHLALSDCFLERRIFIYLQKSHLKAPHKYFKPY